LKRQLFAFVSMHALSSEGSAFLTEAAATSPEGSTFSHTSIFFDFVATRAGTGLSR